MFEILLKDVKKIWWANNETIGIELLDNCVYFSSVLDSDLPIRDGYLVSEHGFRFSHINTQ